MKFNKLVVIIVFAITSSCSFFANATCIYTKENLLKDMYKVLVKNEIIKKNADKYNSLDFIIVVDTVNLNGYNKIDDFAVYEFYSRFESEPFYFVLINYIDEYWVYKSTDIGGIFENLQSIQTKNCLLNNNQIVYIINTINHRKRGFADIIGKIKYVDYNCW